VFKTHDVEAEKAEMSERARVETSFASHAGWLRGSDVDQLSIEEAGLIAERVLRRVEAKMPLAANDKQVLRQRFKELIEARFIRNSGPTTREEWEQKVMEVARPVLGPEQTMALKEALALGFRPRAGEE
jgi:hypothetical protein